MPGLREVAPVRGALRLALPLAARSVALLAVLACSGGNSPTAPPVQPVTVQRVEVGTGADTIAVGDSVALTARAVSAGDTAVAGVRFTWASSDTTVAKVDSTGRVVGVRVGTAIVSATAVAPASVVPTQVIGTTTATVRNVIRRLTISRGVGSDTIAMGDSTRVSATAFDGLAAPVPTAQVAWTTSDTSVATVDQMGLLRARRMGVVIVTATVTGPAADIRGVVRATASVHVRLAFASISAGGAHVCGLARDGSIYCWGENTLGEIGDGAGGSASTPPVSVPTRAVSADTFAEVYASNAAGPDGRTCALTNHGALVCWGSGAYGELADGKSGDDVLSQDYAAVPTHVGTAVYAAASVGYRQTCAATAAGALYCAGSNFAHALGVDTVSATCGPTTPPGVVRESCSSTFVQVSGAPALTRMASAGRTNCGLAADGAAWCWGGNTFGTGGVGYDTPMGPPAAVFGGHRFVALSGGDVDMCGITASGDAYCWGSQQFAETGTGAWSGSLATVPVRVASPVPFVAIASGGSHSCALAAGGDTYCWGLNRHGELGFPTAATCGPPGTPGTGPCAQAPTLVAGAPKFVALSAGAEFTCGLTAAGTAYCWGDNESGELGNGSVSSGGTTVTRVTDTQ